MLFVKRKPVLNYCVLSGQRVAGHSVNNSVATRCYPAVSSASVCRSRNAFNASIAKTTQPFFGIPDSKISYHTAGWAFNIYSLLKTYCSTRVATVLRRSKCTVFVFMRMHLSDFATYRASNIPNAIAMFAIKWWNAYQQWLKFCFHKQESLRPDRRTDGTGFRRSRNAGKEVELWNGCTMAMSI